MPSVSLIVEHLDSLLDPAAYDDYGPNGLQVPGRDAVETVVTGVSANVATFTRAREEGADLVLVHHGLFWGGPPRPLDRASKRRLQILFDSDMSLAAYHLPLDAHPEIGNNALLRDALGLEPDERPFGRAKGSAVGLIGRTPDPIDLAELTRRLTDAVGREPLVFDSGPERIRTVGIVTGAGGGLIPQAVEAGLDTYVTGEGPHKTFFDAEELGINVIYAGHYATETVGVKALAEHLAAKFSLPWTFLDHPTGL
jgi:dinuclear metal center YbgI/SA1388 family protein